MAFRICHFHHAGADSWGWISGESIIPVNAGSLLEFFGRHPDDFPVAGDPVPFNEVVFLPPVSHPSAVICQGKNYSEHIRETGMNPGDKTYNQFFVKASSSIAAGRGVVQRPRGVELLDYEVEVALIIKQDIKSSIRVTEANLHEYIGGVTVANDISARDLQIPQGQWFKGKSFRGFCPVGPSVVIPDGEDLKHFAQWKITLSINGEPRQNAKLSQMVFSPTETLTELSSIMDLHAGDLLLTGTPAGVALRVPGGWTKKLGTLLYSEKKLMQLFVERQKRNPRYLKDGDVVRARLQGHTTEIDSGEMQLTIESEPFS